VIAQINLLLRSIRKVVFVCAVVFGCKW